MARSSSRTVKRASAASVTPRTLFLAGLGAALLAGREAERLALDAASVPQRILAGADAAIEAARIEAQKLSSVARVRLNPLLARVGLPKWTAPRASRKAAKPAAGRRPAAKKSARTTARRA